MQTLARGGPQRAGNRRKFVQEDERLRRAHSTVVCPIMTWGAENVSMK